MQQRELWAEALAMGVTEEQLAQNGVPARLRQIIWKLMPSESVVRKCAELSIQRVALRSAEPRHPLSLSIFVRCPPQHSLQTDQIIPALDQ